jgi:hypothetical protein
MRTCQEEGEGEPALGRFWATTDQEFGVRNSDFGIEKSFVGAGPRACPGFLGNHRGLPLQWVCPMLGIGSR